MNKKLDTTQVAALIKTFSEDVGEQGQEAWRKLQLYPRDRLIESLLDLRNSLPKDDVRQYSVTFTLAYIDYQYKENVSVLTSVLSQQSKQHEYADTVVVMLGRLVERGDKSLLGVLFSNAPSADAALGEALSDVFARQVSADPKGFLDQLKDQPIGTRSRVYKLIKSGPMTEKDLNELRTRLMNLSHDQSVSQIAREMLASLAFKSP
jgi:hypothetical protein